MFGLGAHAQLTHAQLIAFDPEGPFAPLTSADADRLSLLNFCTVFDEILPFPGSGISESDRAHLLGLHIAILPGEAVAAGDLFDGGHGAYIPDTYPGEQRIAGLDRRKLAKLALLAIIAIEENE